jgi:molecular chaperone DnaK (HSP70)
MMIDLDKLEAIWAEMREAQLVSERQLAHLRELATQVEKNNEAMREMLSVAKRIRDEVERVEFKAKNNLDEAIRKLEKELTQTLSSSVAVVKEDIRDASARLSALERKYDDFSRKTERFWKDTESMAEKSMDKIVKRVRNEFDELYDDIYGQGIALQWSVIGAVALGGFLLGAIASYFFVKGGL